MPSDGEVIYEARVDDSKIDSDLDRVEKKVEKSTKDTANKSEKVEKKTGESVKEVKEDVTEHHKKQNDERVKDDEKTGRERENQEKKTGDRLKSIAGTTAKAVGAGLVAAGAAAVTVGAMAVNSAVNMDQAMNQYMASTGKSKEETERYQKVLENIYKNNYGDSFEDIAGAMSQVTKQLGDMSDEELQNVTESAYALRDTFEYDISESTRAAKAMVDNFGISADEAMSKIAAGAQNGLDYSGELMDSISEYSVQFAKVGLDADDMFKIFQKGADSGAFNLDKVGDAIKEMSIRVVDGSKTTKEGFSAIGLDADAMAKKFAAGGDTAKAAFKETIAALAAMEDPIAQNAAGVALFGTQWEDLGAEAVTALAEIEDGAYDTGEAMEGLKAVKYDDLGSMFEGLKRSVELLLLPLGEQLIPILTELIQTIMPVIEEVLPLLTEAVGGFIIAIGPVIEELLPVLMSLLQNLLPPLMQIIEAVLPILVELFSTLLPPLTELISAVLPVLVELVDALLPIFDALLSLLAPLIELFSVLLAPIIELISAALTPLIRIISELIKIAIEPLSWWISTLAEIFDNAFSDISRSVRDIKDNVINIFKNIIDFIRNVFTGNWRDAWQNVKNIFSNIVSGIGNIFKAPINAIISGINTFLRGLNRIKIPDWVPLVGGKGFHIPEIPRLKVGMDYVPSDYYPAYLDEGEAVLTKEENERFRKLGGVAGMELMTAGRVVSMEQQQSEMDYNRMYDAVKSGAEAARLTGYFDARQAGKAVSPTVNQEFETTSGQNRRYTK